MGWPGSWQEAKEICEEIGLPDMNEVDIPVKDIKEAIYEHHHKVLKEELKAEGKGTKKLKDIKNDNFRNVQDYFSDKSVANGRMAFKIRSQMVQEYLLILKMWLVGLQGSWGLQGTTYVLREGIEGALLAL